MTNRRPGKWFKRLFPTARRLLVEADVRRWCIDQHRRVLVIGAGQDPYRNLFAGADSYIALDIVAFRGVTDLVADAEVLPFSDRMFDCVVAIEVMEHLANPMRMAEESYRVLAPGGMLILSVPFAFHQHADPVDWWRPTRHALRFATRKFDKAAVMPQGNRLHTISDLITTAFSPYPVLIGLRIFNHLLVLRRPWSGFRDNRSSAPSGFFVVATK